MDGNASQGFVHHTWIAATGERKQYTRDPTDADM
jgi:hypothetical protein